MTDPVFMPETERERGLWQEYTELLHAVQSGVAFMLERDAAEGTPKHLRVGVNSAHISQQALFRVLLRKGLIDRVEYLAALVECAREEAALYEKRVNELLGGTGNVRLG